jgi:hypothetical protein
MRWNHHGQQQRTATDDRVKPLSEYKSNSRRGYNVSTEDVLYSISDAQLLDLAHFLSRQR